MLLREITLRNLLSFGPAGMSLELRPLNVLIGPNGSGKSNLLEAINLLHTTPTNVAASVREAGGIHDWIWKGKPSSTVHVEVVVNYPASSQPLRHSIEFTETGQMFELLDERIEDAQPGSGPTEDSSYYQFQNGHPSLWINVGGRRELKKQHVKLDESILSQRRDPDIFPELTFLAQSYARIRLYREWSFGRYTAARQPQKADQPNDQLAPDGSNLGLVLNRLRRTSQVKQDLLENLQQLYAGIEDYDVSIEGGTVQVFLWESGFAIPATRLSDGTLRYLCLLVILCNPKPPPLVCIEEPELGLHPDLMPTLARLLKTASERTQLVVTTHSDILIDELTDDPESVVVCEKTDGQTSMKRLESGALEAWLEKYRLGQLWTQGELGGVRW